MGTGLQFAVIEGKVSKFSFTIEALHVKIGQLARASSYLSPAAQFRDTAIGAPLAHS